MNEKMANETLFKKRHLLVMFIFLAQFPCRIFAFARISRKESVKGDLADFRWALVSFPLKPVISPAERHKAENVTTWLFVEDTCHEGKGK